MPKITFDQLQIELTRRCNMRPVCRHCMRGDPQDISISQATIDNLLDQCEMIEELVYIGGEPLLNLQGMDYILSSLETHSIPLYDLKITTNGILDTTQPIKTLMRYADYIAACRRNPQNRYRPTCSEQPLITLSVSIDCFHSHKTTAMQHLAEYQIALSGIAAVYLQDTGNLPGGSGNAAKYLNREDLHLTIEDRFSRPIRRIEILDTDHKPECKYYSTYRLSHTGQRIICCAVFISATGNLLSRDIGAIADYDRMDSPDNIICSVAKGDDIWSSIIRWNSDKYSCLKTECIFGCIDNSIKADIVQHNYRFIKEHPDRVPQALNQNRYVSDISDLSKDEVLSLFHFSDMPNAKRSSIIDGIRQRTQKYDYTQAKQDDNTDSLRRGFDLLRKRWDETKHLLK